MDKLPQQQQLANQHELLSLNSRAEGHAEVENDNIFKFPPDMKDLRQRFQRLLDYAEREGQFYKSLGASINMTDSQPQKDSTTETFEEYRQQDIEVLKKCNELEASAALATYGTIRELTTLYTILDELNTLNKRRTVLKDTKLLREDAKLLNNNDLHRPEILISRSDFKQQRERSKSAISEEISIYDKELNSKQEESEILRSVSAQATFTEGKSKVSKWTKVKAAFKWERANVPALGDGSQHSNDILKYIGLMPLNNEVARYLRVPSMPYGGGTSSADSILSSTSVEVCTPGTMSTASSMDDIEKRNCSKSDTRCNPHISNVGAISSGCCKFLTFNEAEKTNNSNRCNSNNVHTVKSDSEVLPEDGVATKQSRRIKATPSPLNLELQQDLNDLEDLYLLQQLRTPRDGIQQSNRLRKIGSPGNSSVPSSPSRLSDFFESEDLSSGDFSEPTSPNNLSPYQCKQSEINQRYEMLRKKLDMEFEAKRREWGKTKTNANVCRAPAYTLVSLTPEFKKKLQKWRVKKQSGSENEQHTPQQQSILANKEINSETKLKIDWGLWKAGQLKLEGQGLPSLPEHKSLPEKEQWNKIKKNSIADHPINAVQVKTSAGVMKFEGISRKFTRKLYEWEKARGIGPESSTFALLHSGYCPIDVGRISIENKAENSPTLSRSLSLDSITPNISNISQQASSLSLNDVNDLKEREGLNNDVLEETEYKKFEEPEAVMVEVEEHIVDTAKPLVNALIEQQTPIYKYEKITCNDYCNTRHVQSYESHSNLAPLLAVLKRTDELLNELTNFALDVMINEELQQSQKVLSIKGDSPENLTKPPVLNVISDVQSELSRLNLFLNAPIDEACCQELMEERSKAYGEKLELLPLNIEDVDTNTITTELMSPTKLENASNCIMTDARTQTIQSSNSSEFEGDSIIKFEATEQSIAKYKNTSNTSIATSIGSKKKMRLRRMGSRQNSKTESDSSDNDAANALQETPRRWKRKNYRIKQRSFEEDFKKTDESTTAAGYKGFNDDMVYVLRVKPGHAIEQCELSGSRVLISPTESCVQLMPVPPQADCAEANNELLSKVFVKTIRKIFKTVEEPTTCSMVVVEQNLDEINEMIETNENQLLDINNAQFITKNEILLKEQSQLDQDRAVLNENEFELKPKLRQWSSWSWHGGVREIDYYDKRKYLSSDNLNFEFKRGFRAPLATDSFKINKRNCSCFGNPSKCAVPKRKEHLFRKNTEKFYKIFTKSSTKKTKASASLLGEDNLVSKPQCKLCNNLTATPIVDTYSNGFFEPSSKRDRQHFLEGKSFNRHENELKRELSDQSHQSDHNTSTDIEEGNLLKSSSAGTILQAGHQQKQQNETTYDTLRSRSEKLSTRLGFASIASKFRRAKKDTKDTINYATNTVASSSSALSTLWQQGANSIAMPHAIPAAAESSHQKEAFAVKKSQSSQAAMGYLDTNAMSSSGLDKLNKSKSEQHVRNHRS